MAFPKPASQSWNCFPCTGIPGGFLPAYERTVPLFSVSADRLLRTVYLPIIIHKKEGNVKRDAATGSRYWLRCNHCTHRMHLP